MVRPGAFSPFDNKSAKYAQLSHWDKITVTVGTPGQGQFMWTVDAEVKDGPGHHTGVSNSEGAIDLTKTQKTTFVYTAPRGPITIGTDLGRFVMSSPNGNSITGVVTVLPGRELPPN
jgi:hypothetical protein